MKCLRVAAVTKDDPELLKERKNVPDLDQEIEIEDALEVEIVDEDAPDPGQETDVGIGVGLDHVIGNTEAVAVIENLKSNVTTIKKRKALRTRKDLHLLLSKKRIQRLRIWIFQILRNFLHMYM